MTTTRVHLAAPEGDIPVGTAHIDRRRGVTTTRFAYDAAYLAAGWGISPDLPVLRNDTVVEDLPGALADSAPDAWGRNLITRRLAAQARDAGQVAPDPTEADFLLGVSDSTRQGALRFTVGEGPFLAECPQVPRLLDLQTLLSAAQQVVDGDDDRVAVQTLLDAGSGSLGGARPKASVTDGERLLIAKFPLSTDDWDVIRWEAVALDLAERCEISTPTHDLHEVGRVPVLLVERFDRDGDARVPYLSASSLTGRESGDYLEIVEAIAEHGSDVVADLVRLWRRVAFSIAINNIDDHLRNHGFLRGHGGWTSSPVFDLNPDPSVTRARVTSLAGATTSSDCREALFETAAQFGLDVAKAVDHWRSITDAVSGWRELATARRIPAGEQDRFAAVLDRYSP